MSNPARKARTPRPSRGIKATKDSKFKPLRAGCTVLNWANAMENTIEYVEAKMNALLVTLQNTPLGEQLNTDFTNMLTSSYNPNSYDESITDLGRAYADLKNIIERDFDGDVKSFSREMREITNTIRVAVMSMRGYLTLIKSAGWVRGDNEELQKQLRDLQNILTITIKVTYAIKMAHAAYLAFSAGNPFMFMLNIIGMGGSLAGGLATMNNMGGGRI
jgi:hypothetical protein